MLETRIMILVAIVIVASGCTDITGENDNSFEESHSIGQGLAIESFDVSDSTLYPGQRAVIMLKMRNHHIDEIEIDEMTLYNLGPLELVEPDQNWQERCTNDEIPTAQHGDSPLIECEWRIEAQEDLGDFRSKSVHPRLQLRYDSVLSNKKHPLEIQFEHYTDIDSPTQVQETYGNEEISMTAEVENPAAIGGTRLGIKFSNTGAGKVIPISENDTTKTFYEVDVSPDPVFNDCSPSFEVTSPVDPETEDSCEIHAPGGEAVGRNLVFSTSYKYQRSQSVGIEVVNDQ